MAAPARRAAAPPAAVLAALLAAVAAGPATAAAAPGEPPGPPPAERSTLTLLQWAGAALEAAEYARAGDLFREAAELDPRLPQAHLGLGLAALGDGDGRGAERSLRRVFDLGGGSPETRYALGIARFVFEGPRDAQEDLQAAAAADRLFLEARYTLGMAAARRDDLPRAADALRDAIQIDPGHAAPHYLLGAVLARAGDHDGALRELSLGLAADPRLLNPRPEDRLLFVRRAVPAAGPATGSARLPIPLIRPSLGPVERRAARSAAAAPGEIPEWYLCHFMALRLEDAGRWREAAGLLERALVVKDRSERLAVVADRLVDYSPHLHLARAYHRLSNYRQALLHLGLARNEGNASPESLNALKVLIEKDRLRPRILLEPLPDRTSAGTVTVRGVVFADEPVPRVEVAGRPAALRPARPEEIESLRTGRDGGAATDDRPGILFEAEGLPLEAGANLIVIRPQFTAPGLEGDLIEAVVVRVPPAEGTGAGPPARRSDASRR